MPSTDLDYRTCVDRNGADSQTLHVSTGREQTLLQTLILPVFILPTLLPTPLLEPRYFLIPFILLRAQIADVAGWAVVLEGLCYSLLFSIPSMNKSSQPNAGASPRNKPRNSIRLSLGLASKAFADVINKESSRDTDKSARKAKETSSRRLSGIALKPAAPRASMGEAKPPSQVTKRVATPESKTVTRRRVSVGLGRASMDEQPSKPLETSGRVATLRPKTAGSALPKYRPKSTLIESSKPPSPATGMRRPFSSSEDEKEDRPAPKSAPFSSDKVFRPISPLPHRAALKSNTRAVNATPPPSNSSKPPTTPSRASSTRPTKFAKVVTPTSSTSSSIPRPSSSTSTSGSPTRTPNTPSLKNMAARRAAQEKSSKASPSPHPSHNESPLARHPRTISKGDSPTPGASAVGNMSHISEGDSEDSEAEDVALLLAPVASLAAPTPAMPRIQTTRTRKRLPPQTPTRANNLLPTRANMSYLSPLPPGVETSSSFLRPPQQRGEKQARGSILSWEQLANEASRTLGEDEIDSMLSDIPAPFHPDAVSPTPSHTQLDIPESPCLSAMSSPGGYGSISQVLLPDVTPSPALHHQQSARYDLSSDLPAVDAAIVTLLRLQLAAAENTAKERLTQMQTMEEEIHNLKQCRGREVLHFTEQVGMLEEQLKGSLEMRERTEEDRALYTRNLEDQLRRELVVRDQAVEAAVLKGQEIASATHHATLQTQRDSIVLACSARIASSEWASVHGLAEMELDVVREEREVLSHLLIELAELTHSIL
ncbi:hypothetical protein DXG01_004266 [Tephrocybe rancida]|nr:hypothetical protein DXG01_004266 [Tephrocybe rancida]